MRSEASQEWIFHVPYAAPLMNTFNKSRHIGMAQNQLYTELVGTPKAELPAKQCLFLDMIHDDDQNKSVLDWSFVSGWPLMMEIR